MDAVLLDSLIPMSFRISREPTIRAGTRIDRTSREKQSRSHLWPEKRWPDGTFPTSPAVVSKGFPKTWEKRGYVRKIWSTLMSQRTLAG